MHHCLELPEIVSNIAEEIAADEDKGPSPWATLASLARTCRVISEPALDSLWKVQSSLVPLLQTMPADLWWQDPSIGTWITIRRPVVPTDWARFRTYAPRIRHFVKFQEDNCYGVPNRGDTYLNPKSLQALALAGPTDADSFCPHVRSLDWEMLVDNTNESISCMALFMGAATTSVALDTSKLSLPGLLSVLSIIANFPSLQKVAMKSYSRRHYSGHIGSAVYASHLWEIFAQGRGLQSIELDDPLPRAVAVLLLVSGI